MNYVFSLAKCTGFKCHDGECVGNSTICNSIMDCADGSDEDDCSKFSVFSYLNAQDSLKYMSLRFILVSHLQNSYRKNTCISHVMIT